VETSLVVLGTWRVVVWTRRGSFGCTDKSVRLAIKDIRLIQSLTSVFLFSHPGSDWDTHSLDFLPAS
jgi:hypothetical protein